MNLKLLSNAHTLILKYQKVYSVYDMTMDSIKLNTAFYPGTYLANDISTIIHRLETCIQNMKN